MFQLDNGGRALLAVSWYCLEMDPREIIDRRILFHMSLAYEIRRFITLGARFYEDGTGRERSTRRDGKTPSLYWISASEMLRIVTESKHTSGVSLIPFSIPLKIFSSSQIDLSRIRRSEMSRKTSQSIHLALSFVFFFYLRLGRP